ncbi:MAG: ABC transporter ATP-binding protein [Peptococcaceae bacterium]|jgi:ABC-2 type transport system ATP-binding protein|nr:ABC transporter ATP-binding protein [Peptococcaceae bacterium]
MVIDVNNVWKRFRLREDRADGFAKLFTSFLSAKRRGREKTEFWALREISFTVEENSSFGIIGVNGSGKSTMLKLLTGTMRSTRGEIRVKGRKSSLIELGAGFHPDFSGRDNVYLNGLILGLSKNDIRKKFDEIVAFSELEQFIDVPVKYYSSGMHARLGFSVAIAVEPDVLIIDEVLAVGDINFREKCMDRIARMQKEGVSVVLVSHSLGDVERICDKVLWIHRGMIMGYGDAGKVAADYRAYH